MCFLWSPCKYWLAVKRAADCRSQPCTLLTSTFCGIWINATVFDSPPPSPKPPFHDPHMSDDTGLVTAGRRRRLSPEPVSPLENADTLSEILLCLPPDPSSLLRASMVCNLWRRVLSDPAFLRRFRTRHRCSPPLLGFLKEGPRKISFTPILDPPNQIPSGRFSLHLDDTCRIMGCRHGLVLIHNRFQHQLLVWDPVSGDCHHIVYPPEFAMAILPIEGSVLRAAGDVNGDGDSSHFQVVLVCTDIGLTQAIASVYSSETGKWADLISTTCPSMSPSLNSGTLVGGSLYWFLMGRSSIGVLEFDLERQCLAVIDIPQDMVQHHRPDSIGQFRVMPTEGGGLGFLFLSSFKLQLWKRKTDGDAGWVLGNSIELDKLLSLNLEGVKALSVYGYVEENNVLLVTSRATIFVIQLDSMQLKKSIGTPRVYCGIPFSCVYTAGMGIEGRPDGTELLQNT